MEQSQYPDGVDHAGALRYATRNLRLAQAQLADATRQVATIDETTLANVAALLHEYVSRCEQAVSEAEVRIAALVGESG